MDSDDEELAQLRAQRAGGRAPVSGLGNTSYYVDAQVSSRKRPRTAAPHESEPEVEWVYDTLPSGLPASFGRVEPESDQEDLHSQRSRKVAADGLQGAQQAGRQGEERALIEEAPLGGVVDVEEAEGQGLLPLGLPVTHEAVLEGQGKAVAALAVDPAGVRVLAGSRDYSVRMYDFAGMKSDLKSFRRLEPHEGHPVHALSFSPTGHRFLAVTGSAKIKIYDREGKEQGESLQGDMYIRDAKNTKGHVSPATCGQWHPTDREAALTGSEDGTVRIWDVELVRQRTVVKPQLKKPGRVAVTAALWGPGGGLLAAGLRDGSIHLWDSRGKFGTSAAIGQVLPPKAQMVQQQDWKFVSGNARRAQTAHEAGADITALAFPASGLQLASRSTDGTVKVWDTRKFQAPVCVASDLPTSHATAGLCYSPDDHLLLTGVELEGEQKGAGAVACLDAQEGTRLHTLAVPAPVVSLCWHPRINQILLGTGDRGGGAVRVLYDPRTSQRGVLLCATRQPRAPEAIQFQAPLVIHNPHALQLFREPQPTSGKRAYTRNRADPRATQAPDKGQAVPLGSGHGGRLGTTGGTLLTQYVLKNHGKLRNPKEEDIRTAFLRHAGNEGQFKDFSKAYEKTQPDRIFQEEEDDTRNTDKK